MPLLKLNPRLRQNVIPARVTAAVRTCASWHAHDVVVGARFEVLRD
jgi:hypothetical protein